MVHYHLYVTRVPGLQANGGPESEPDHPGFRFSKVPPRLTRRWLLRDTKLIEDTFATPGTATDWYAEWIEKNPRPDSSYFSGEPQEAQRARKVEFVLKTLTGADDVVDGFYTAGGEYTAVYIIPCPPRVDPPFRTRDGKDQQREPWRCPLGRTS